MQNHHIAATAIAITAMPPTVPPTMAPTGAALLSSAAGSGVEVGEVLGVFVGEVVGSKYEFQRVYVSICGILANYQRDTA